MLQPGGRWRCRMRRPSWLYMLPRLLHPPVSMPWPARWSRSRARSTAMHEWPRRPRSSAVGCYKSGAGIRSALVARAPATLSELRRHTGRLQPPCACDARRHSAARNHLPLIGSFRFRKRAASALRGGAPRAVRPVEGGKRGQKASSEGLAPERSQQTRRRPDFVVCRGGGNFSSRC